MCMFAVPDDTTNPDHQDGRHNQPPAEPSCRHPVIMRQTCVVGYPTTLVAGLLTTYSGRSDA